MITRKQYEDEQFPGKHRNSKIQMTFLKILYDNKDKAFTAEEMAKEIYGDKDEYGTPKAYSILKRLKKRGLVERKENYWVAIIKDNSSGLVEPGKFSPGSE